MLKWLQLLRLPAVFTALADVLCGFLTATALCDSSTILWAVLPLLLLATSGLYLAGMVLNDVCDAELDAIERPERPIPSGRISRSSALCLALLLAAVGLIASGVVAGLSQHFMPIAVAAAITCAVVLYDAWLKSTVLGPIGMAVCRALNICLGASPVLLQEHRSMLTHPALLGLAAGLGLYIVGVTWFARYEAGTVRVSGLWAGLVTAVCGVAASGVTAVWFRSPRIPALVPVMIYVVIVVVTLRRGQRAIHDASSPVLQRTVGRMLLWIIALDASAVLAVSGNVIIAIGVALLAVPAIQLRKVISLS